MAVLSRLAGYRKTRTSATDRAIMILLGDDEFNVVSPAQFAILTEDSFTIDTEDGIAIEYEPQAAPQPPQD